MFDSLIFMFNDSPIRFWVTLISLIIIFGLIIWVSIIDIRKQSIPFWKMLIASSSLIIFPFIGTFLCECPYIKWYILGAFPLWFFMLFLNIKFNHDKRIGRADIDILSALFSETIMLSIWMVKVMDSNVAWIRVTHAWYSLFLYLLMGALVYLIIFMVIFAIKIAKGSGKMKDLIRDTKVSLIPMFIPASIMIPYTIMTI